MKASRVLLPGAGVVAVAAALALAVGVLTIRSDWFREKVQQRIVREAEQATGGKVEIGAFRFRWNTLTAEFDDLTIHGSEQGMKPVQAPLLYVKHAAIGLKIISLMERSFSVARVEVDSPRGHLMVMADGTTNIRPPKEKSNATVVDLKIGRFAVYNGVLLVDVAGRAPQPVPLSGHGENLLALLHFDGTKARYAGEVSVAPAHLEIAGIQPLDISVKADVGVEKTRVTSSSAVVKTRDSEVTFTGLVVDHFEDPVISAAYRARVAMEEVDRAFQLVNFQHTGKVDLVGSGRFVSMRDFRVTGNARGSGLGYGEVQNISASGSFVATPDLVRLNGIRLDALGGNLQASGEVRDLKRFNISGEVSGLGTAAVTSVANVKPLPWNGVLAGPFHASGNLSEREFHDVLADAQVTITPVENATPVHGEIAARFDGAAQQVRFDPSWVGLPGSRVDFSGVPNQRMDVRVRTRDVNELKPGFAIPPVMRAAAGSFEGSLIGSLDDPRVTGHAVLNGIFLEDGKLSEHIESLDAEFSASDSSLVLEKASAAWNGLRADVKGSLGLEKWRPTDRSPLLADFQIANASVPKLLAIAERADIPLSGTLSAKGQVAGTVGDPQFSGDFKLANGQVRGEPFDSISGQSRYSANGASQAAATVIAGEKRLSIIATLDQRKVKFDVTTNTMALDQIVLVRNRAPEIRGTARVRVSGIVAISPDGRQISIEEIAGDVAASGLALGTRSLGEAHLSGSTKNGVFSGRFTSNAANASIRADGTVGLNGDYPVMAKISMSGVKLSNVNALLNPGEKSSDAATAVDGSMEGQATVTGSARTPDQLIAEIELSRLELHPATVQAQQNLHGFAISNEGPVRMRLADSVLRVGTAHFRGPETDMEAGGQIALRENAPLDLMVRGTMNTALAKAWQPDMTAAGTIAVNATLRGTFDKPDFIGRLELQNGEFRYAGFSNGLSNVKGVAVFSGTRATIQSFTGESGGGTVEMTGFASVTDGVIAFRVEAKGRGVRVRYPEGISSVSDADLVFAGTEQRSEASGKITVRRVAINPKSDAASILAQASSPIRTVSANAGFATNINLDIQVETAVDVVFETNMAQGVQADANLRLRGTVTNPAVLGRINVTHGDMVFFGNKYSVSQGSLTFSDPARIAPILNVDLETKARGVTVTLTISGPINKLNVSYRSDPPLQFADVVALLATGRSPSSATLATDTGQSPNFQQLNGNALLGQALTNPAADRLQRFFGVSRIKIDPQLTGVTGSPEARLTVEQEVTPSLLFTYVSDVSNTSTQLIRVEWSFSRTWSTILTRDENGYVFLDFAYRKRFK